MRKVLTRGLIVLTAITAVRSVGEHGGLCLAAHLHHIRKERRRGVDRSDFTIAATFLGAIPGQFVFGVLVERLDKRYVLGVSSAGAGLAVLGYISDRRILQRSLS